MRHPVSQTVLSTSPQRKRSRFAPTLAGVCLALAAATLSSGCTDYDGRGWNCPNKVQVQFYAPPGAGVAVRKCLGADWQVVAPDSMDHRLEHDTKQYAAFNLPTGRSYNFKYTSPDGFPDVNIYGRLEVPNPEQEETRKFVAHAFVPVVLLSRYQVGDEHYYPVRGPSGSGLNQLEMEHLRQGDLIRKVYFVADLQKAWETIRAIDYHIERLRSAETVLNSELQLVDARYEMYRQDALYGDPTEDSLTRHKDSTGQSGHFVTLEAKRQGLENERYLIRNQVDDLSQEKRIRTRLLDSMRIINRRGSMVLATPENQWPFHDTFEQIDEDRSYAGHRTGPMDEYRTGDIVIPALGEVVLEMSIGGRHKHWGPPAGEMVSVAMTEETRVE